MFPKYVDPSYEGLSIKLPIWFVDINKDELQPILEKLQKFLEEKALSNRHPDVVNSVFEIKNLADKKETFLLDLKRTEERREKEREMRRALVRHDILPTFWQTEGSVSNDTDDIEFPLINGETVKFEKSFFMTPKGNETNSGLKKLTEIHDQIDLKKFAIRNGLMELMAFVSYMPENVDWKQYLKLSGFSRGYAWGFRVKYSIMKLKHYTQIDRYYDCSLRYDKNGDLCYLCGGKEISLENYELVRGEFRRKI